MLKGWKLPSKLGVKGEGVKTTLKDILFNISEIIKDTISV